MFMTNSLRSDISPIIKKFDNNGFNKVLWDFNFIFMVCACRSQLCLLCVILGVWVPVWQWYLGRLASTSLHHRWMCALLFRADLSMYQYTYIATKCTHRIMICLIDHINMTGMAKNIADRKSLHSVPWELAHALQNGIFHWYHIAMIYKHTTGLFMVVMWKIVKINLLYVPAHLVQNHIMDLSPTCSNIDIYANSVGYTGVTHLWQLCVLFAIVNILCTFQVWLGVCGSLYGWHLQETVLPNTHVYQTMRRFTSRPLSRSITRHNQ